MREPVILIDRCVFNYKPTDRDRLTKFISHHTYTASATVFTLKYELLNSTHMQMHRTKKIVLHMSNTTIKVKVAKL